MSSYEIPIMRLMSAVQHRNILKSSLVQRYRGHFLRWGVLSIQRDGQFEPIMSFESDIMGLSYRRINIWSIFGNDQAAKDLVTHINDTYKMHSSEHVRRRPMHFNTIITRSAPGDDRSPKESKVDENKGERKVAKTTTPPMKVTIRFGGDKFIFGNGDEYYLSEHPLIKNVSDRMDETEAFIALDELCTKPGYVILRDEVLYSGEITSDIKVSDIQTWCDSALTKLSELAPSYGKCEITPKDIEMNNKRYAFKNGMNFSFERHRFESYNRGYSRSFHNHDLYATADDSGASTDSDGTSTEPYRPEPESSEKSNGFGSTHPKPYVKKSWHGNRAGHRPWVKREA